MNPNQLNANINETEATKEVGDIDPIEEAKIYTYNQIISAGDAEVEQMRAAKQNGADSNVLNLDLNETEAEVMRAEDARRSMAMNNFARGLAEVFIPKAQSAEQEDARVGLLTECARNAVDLAMTYKQSQEIASFVPAGNNLNIELEE